MRNGCERKYEPIDNGVDNLAGAHRFRKTEQPEDGEHGFERSNSDNVAARVNGD